MKRYDIDPEDEDQDDEEQEEPEDEQDDILPPGPMLIESR